MSCATVYNDSTQESVFSDARAAMVSSLNTFIEDMRTAGVTPNLTGAHDSHLVSGVPPPYATVGITRATFENYGAGSSTYDIMVRMECQVFIHFSAMGDTYNERFRWDVLNSLFNYYKNTKRMNTDHDGLLIESMESDVQFPVTQTSGAVFTLQLWKVVST